MNTNDIFKVVLSGNFDGDSKYVYCYPSSALRQNPAPLWKNSVPTDPRTIRDRLKSPNGYALWVNENGHYYSYIFQNKSDWRGGFAIVTVNVAPGCGLLHGHDVLTLLNQLHTMLIDQQCRDDAQVGALLAQYAQRLRPIPSTFAMRGAVEGFCTYQSENDLVNRLGYPDQNAYRDCRILWMVQEQGMSAPQESAQFKRIMAPVQRMFSLVIPLPAGVTVKLPMRGMVQQGASWLCLEGETITVNYSREGFNPQSFTMKVQEGASHLVFNGDRFAVKSADQAGVSFTKTLRVKVNRNGANLSAAERQQAVVKAQFITAQGPRVEQLQYSPSSGCFEKELSENLLNDLMPGKPIKVGAKLPQQSDSTIIDVAYDQLGLPYNGAPTIALPVTVTRPVGGLGGSSGGYHRPMNEPSGMRVPKWMAAAVCLLALVGVGALGYGCYKWIFADDKPETEAEAPKAEGGEETNGATEQMNEEADLKYLEQNSRWDITKLQSQKYKEVVQAAIGKNWEKFASYGDDIQNENYRKVAAAIKRFNQQERPGEVANKLRQAVEGNVVNLETCKSALNDLQAEVDAEMNQVRDLPPAQPQRPGNVQGRANGPGQGNANRPGQGNANRPDQGNVNRPGQGNANRPGQGNVNRPGQGNANRPGQGNVNRPGQGNTNKPGQGNTNKPGGGAGGGM